MDNMIEKNNNISLAKYISKIKKKLLYHYDLPEELKNNISIIHAEVAAKTRVFGLRGYDVIRNRFFVSQVVKIKKYGTYGEECGLCTDRGYEHTYPRGVRGYNHQSFERVNKNDKG